MSIQSPFKLEINIISAHDLPPVSKMLRTFAVAYINPDHKLTTKIDHHGHTNPTWNYKVLFHVDEKFLKQESSAVTIEIYNLAWLRDLPIGTARLSIGHLSPPLIKNPAFRRVALKITRPSGHLQGTLNIGVQLVENAINVNNSGDQALCMFNSLRDVELTEDEEEEEEEDKNTGFQDQEKNPGPEINSRPEMNNSRPESVSVTPESKYTNMPGSEHETNASFFSTMKPLPSEVADGLKKGVYDAEWTEYGSSVFENWTEHGDNKSDLPAENVEWPVMMKENLIPLKMMSDKSSDCNSCTKRSEKKKNKGLFSCFFGNAYGFEFSIICGSNDMKKSKKKMMMKNKMNRNVNKQNVHLMTMPQQDFRKFYV